MGATKIMIIRHAEKPDSTYFGVNATASVAGKTDGVEFLTTVGWQRTGALVTLFAPPWGPQPSLATPQFLFASDPGDPDAGDGGPSQRPYETLTAISAVLKLTIDARFKKKHYDKMVAAALDCAGTVLIAWQHEDIPLRTKAGDPGISQVILTQTQTPAGRFQIPTSWPKNASGARYDLVFAFDRPQGSGPITGFSLVNQRLLAGDEGV